MIDNKEKYSEITSGWPLPDEGIRFITPQFLIDELAADPLSKDLYPIAIGYYPSASNHHMARRSHNNHLLIYCSQGKGMLNVSGNKQQVKAGDIILLPRGIAHAYRANTRNPWSIYWVHYKGSLSDNYSGFMDIRQHCVSIGLQPRLIADFEALFALRDAGYSKPAFIQGACQLKAMLTNIAIMITQYRPQRGQHIDLNHIQELMYRRITDSLDLDALAAEASISKYHFSRRFKQLTGHSPIQHFIHLKMQYACQLLDSTPQSVKQIAIAVGYNDPYYFSRIFKQVIGLSPVAYRRNRQV